MWLIQTIALATVYYVFGRLGLLLAIPPGYATAVWPPAGIALAAVLIWGCRVAPGVWLGSFVLNLSISLAAAPDGEPIPAICIAASIGLGAALQAAVGAWLVRRWAGYPNPLADLPQIGKFLLLGGPAACLIGATWGVATLVSAGYISFSECLFSWWTWWVGDTIAILLLTPLAIIACPFLKQSCRRQISVALPMFATFVLSVAAFSWVRHWEQQRTKLEFEKQSSFLGMRLQHNFDKHLENLDALARLYGICQKVDSDEFRGFVLPSIVHHPGLVGYSWNVRVKDQDRAVFEMAAQRSGHRNFRIREQEEGQLKPAARRDEYIVVRLMEPLAENLPALGLDVLSLADRKAAASLARDTAKPAATRCTTLLQRGQRQDGVLIYHPVYHRGSPVETLAQRRSNLEGFVAVALLIGDVVNSSLRGMDDQDITLQIEESNAAGKPEVFFTNGPSKSPVTKFETELGYCFPYQVVGRNWNFRFLPTRTYLARQRSWALWMVTTGGLLFTSLLGVFLLVVTGQSARTEELVAARTAELAESEQRIKLALEFSQQGLWDWDISSGAVVLDENWFAILGYLPGELPAHLSTWEATLHPDDKQTVHEELARHLESNSNLYDVEYRAKTKCGSWIWLNSRGSVQARNAEGIAQRMMGTIQDITGRKLAEEQLAARAAELARSNSELERFAYVASHDLREPLRMVYSFCTLLQERYRGKLDERADRYIRFAVDGATRMQSLIDDLLEYSRVGRSQEQMETVDLGTALNSALANLKLAIGESKARLHSDPLPQVQGDKLRLTQVFQNLVSNALKFRGQEVPRIKISAAREGDFWRISVEDNGIGIDQQYFDRIFMVFQRLHAQTEYPGTGVGLALCKRILELHGGRIWLDSTPGGGTTFHFTLFPAKVTSLKSLEGVSCSKELVPA